ADWLSFSYALRSVLNAIPDLTTETTCAIASLIVIEQVFIPPDGEIEVVGQTKNRLVSRRRWRCQLRRLRRLWGINRIAKISEVSAVAGDKFRRVLLFGRIQIIDLKHVGFAAVLGLRQTEDSFRRAICAICNHN